MSGPRNFLVRLNTALSKYHLPPYQILTPGPHPIVSNQKQVIIARFDGVFMYRFTPACAYNFVRITKQPQLPPLVWLENSKLGSIDVIDRALARYLNRHNIKLKRLADVLVYQSNLSHQEHVFIHGADPKGKPIFRISNGVPLDVFQPQAVHIHPTGSPRLVITAQFRLGKRLREAILITNRLRKAFPKATLHVIGTMDRLVEESIKNLNLDACVFHGQVNSEALPSLYSGMDIGLSPSLFDSCPNSVIEMLATGLPVLTTSASGAAELVPDQSLIIPEDSPVCFTEFHNFRRILQVDEFLWCEAIEQVLNNKKILSEQCLQHARSTFCINQIAEQYKNLILEQWNAKPHSINSDVCT